ncbi:MAG: HAMP domain-containing histidine kinase, partial [Gemmatimonadetes bacterium]|nr:HAMP domain-containing histidine kinase [Gemmatimonadota bacterium]
SLTGLDFLHLQAADGRILSSGHFRNEYDDRTAAPLTALRERREPTLVSGRGEEGTFLALARVDSLRLGDRTVFLTAGQRVDADFLRRLSPSRELGVSLVTADRTVSPDPSLTAALRPESLVSTTDRVLRGLPVAVIEPNGATSDGYLVVTHSLATRRALLQRLDRWLLLAGLAAAVGAFVLAGWVAARFTRPIERLATGTRNVDLDRLDTRFATDRSDEIGTLSRFLDEMMGRLRGSVVRLQDAERRSTLGELARQVNHDLRNAFTPLRNVVRHLTEVARDTPEDLPRVYAERRETLEAGLGYLDDLATNWRRVAAARPERGPCDVERTVRQVVDGRPETAEGRLHTDVAGAGAVLANPVGLRRILENLVANACESSDSGSIRIRAVAGDDAVHIEVQDEGPGLAPETRERIFDDFFTTKPEGSGLGLSVVRRLVSDYEGTVDVTSEPGRGATFRVSLPRAGRSDG